jgi:hypothetical protein
MIEALAMRAEKSPGNPEAQYHIAVKYWEKACTPARPQCQAMAATTRQRPEFIEAGLDAAEKALDIRGDYIDALAYKNLLLRSKAYVEPRRAEALTKEADDLLDQIQQIQERRKAAASAGE